MIRSLEELKRRFASETYWLLNAFLDAATSGSQAARSTSLQAEMGVIRLHDAWARFCRELIVSSAGSGPATASGYYLPRAPNIRRRSDVIPVLLATYTKQKYEPRWANAGSAIDAAKRLEVANRDTISAALGAMNSPAEELRRVRNYFAHRGESTADEIIELPGLPGRPVNWERLGAEQLGGGVTRFELWVIRLRAVAEAAIQ